MRHGSSKRKFHRTSKQRDAFMVSLAVALIQNNRIVTTQARAKELKPYIEKLITKCKVASLATTKLINSRLPKMSATKLIKEIAPKFADRKGGYTRIRLMAQRTSDASKMALIEFVS